MNHNESFRRNDLEEVQSIVLVPVPVPVPGAPLLLLSGASVSTRLGPGPRPRPRPRPALGPGPAPGPGPASAHRFTVVTSSSCHYTLILEKKSPNLIAAIPPHRTCTWDNKQCPENTRSDQWTIAPVLLQWMRIISHFRQNGPFPNCLSGLNSKMNIQLLKCESLKNRTCFGYS